MVVKVLRGRGFRLRRYRSTTLTDQMLFEADLVLGIATEHVEAVLLTAPQKWPRVFSLKELIRRSDAVGGRRPGETFDDWLDRVHSGRVLSELRQFAPIDDISDPIGGPRRAHEEMAEEVDALTKRLAGLLAGPRHTWSMEVEGLPPISLGATWPGDRGHSPGQHLQAAPGVPQDDDDDEGETSMKADALDPDGVTGEGLRATREALGEARETLVQTAQQLAELLQPAADAGPTVPPDAYTQLGDEVAAVMRSAGAQSSVVREDAERYARRVRTQAEAEALALRQQSQADAAETCRKAQEESAALRREADTASTTLLSEAGEQAQVTLKEAGEEAMALRAQAAAERKQASIEASDLRRAAEVDTTEMRERAEHDTAGLRLAAEEDARLMRWEAEQEAGRIVDAASGRYAQLVAAEADLRSRLEGAAGALVSALDGRQPMLPAPLVLGRSAAEDPGEPGPQRSGVSDSSVNSDTSV